MCPYRGLTRAAAFGRNAGDTPGAMLIRNKGKVRREVYKELKIERES